MHIAKWKESFSCEKNESHSLKRLHIVWFNIYDILEKVKLWRQKKKNPLLPEVWEEVGSDGGGAQMMYGGCMTLCICPKTIKLYNTKGDPRVNYGLELMIPYQHRFINCNKCTTPMQDVGNRGNWGSIWELSVVSAPFLCKPKTAPSKVYKLKKINRPKCSDMERSSAGLESFYSISDRKARNPG